MKSVYFFICCNFVISLNGMDNSSKNHSPLAQSPMTPKLSEYERMSPSQRLKKMINFKEPINDCKRFPKK